MDANNTFNGTNQSQINAFKIVSEANVRAAEKDYYGAIKLYSDAISMFNQDFRFYLNRSYCYAQLELYQLALDDAQRATHLCPTSTKCYFRKGQALVGLRKFAEAERAFREGLLLDPNCCETKNELFKVKHHALLAMGIADVTARFGASKYESIKEAVDALLAESFERNDGFSLSKLRQDGDWCGSGSHNHNNSGSLQTLPNLIQPSKLESNYGTIGSNYNSILNINNSNNCLNDFSALNSSSSYFKLSDFIVGPGNSSRISNTRMIGNFGQQNINSYDSGNALNGLNVYNGRASFDDTNEVISPFNDRGNNANNVSNTSNNVSVGKNIENGEVKPHSMIHKNEKDVDILSCNQKKFTCTNLQSDLLNDAKTQVQLDEQFVRISNNTANSGSYNPFDQLNGTFVATLITKSSVGNSTSNDIGNTESNKISSLQQKDVKQISGDDKKVLLNGVTNIHNQELKTVVLSKAGNHSPPQQTSYSDMVKRVKPAEANKPVKSVDNRSTSSPISHATVSDDSSTASNSSGYSSSDKESGCELSGGSKAKSTGTNNNFNLNSRKPTNLWGYKGLRVANVSNSCSKSSLHNLFSKFGRVKLIERVNNKTVENNVWVYYENFTAPIEAVTKLQGQHIEGLSNGSEPLRLYFAPTDDQKDLKFSRPKQPADNKNECYYWRTTNCFSREACPLLHLPANKNIDAQIWMKINNISNSNGVSNCNQECNASLNGSHDKTQ